MYFPSTPFFRSEWVVEAVDRGGILRDPRLAVSRGDLSGIESGSAWGIASVAAVVVRAGRLRGEGLELKVHGIERRLHKAQDPSASRTQQTRRRRQLSQGFCFLDRYFLAGPMSLEAAVGDAIPTMAPTQYNSLGIRSMSRYNVHVC